MLQPDLGKRLTELRKAKNLTQEELVECSHVSVRTIQRIEAGEVIPRISTVKILVASLGASMEELSTKNTNTMDAASITLTPVRRSNTMLIAVVAGAIYLALEIIVIALDLLWITSEEPWAAWLNILYIGITVLLIAAYFFFIRGFLVLGRVFDNKLLTIGAWLMVVGVAAVGILDVSMLGAEDLKTLWIPYTSAAVLTGTLSIVFGVALLRLQDSMGQLSRVAGLLEIVMGCCLITVVLFFMSYVMVIPAVIVEMLVLYRGYEYLSRSEGTPVG
jgi:transcriptional regulator with XRE-family HTH domain